MAPRRGVGLILGACLATSHALDGATLRGADHGAVIAVSEPEVKTAQAVSKPNVLLVLVDDQGHGDIDLGSEKAEFHTPTLATLATSGVRLANFYAGATCTPSRAMLMTGRYTMRYGFQDSVIHATEPRGVPLNEVFLPEKLKKVGYTTGLVGKWHLGMHQDAYVPLNRGFDLHYGILTGGGSHTKHISVSQKVIARGQSQSITFSGANLWDNGQFSVDNKADVHSTQLYTKRTLDMIDHFEGVSVDAAAAATAPKGSAALAAASTSAEKKPWFLFLSFQAIHDPIEVGDEKSITETACNAISTDLTTRRTLCGMMAEVDEGLRQIKERLLDLKAWDRTLLVYASDNGGLMSHGSSNAPFKGEKGMYYEGGVHVPAFISGGFLTSALAAAGKAPFALSSLSHISDLHATVAAAAGYDLAEEEAVSGMKADGQDLWSQLVPVDEVAAAASARSEVLINLNSALFGNSAALRVGNYKLMINADPAESTIYMKVKAHLQGITEEPSAAEVAAFAADEAAKIVDGKKFLFNLEKNPSELDEGDACADAEACSNLAGLPEFAEVQASLEARLAELRIAAAPSSFAWSDDGALANPVLFANLWSPWRDANGDAKALYLGLNRVDSTATAPATLAAGVSAAAAGAGRGEVATALVAGGALFALVAFVAFKAGHAKARREEYL